MYKKKTLMNIVKMQLSYDYNCKLSDFDQDVNIITDNKLNDGRRVYDSDGCFLKIMCIEGKAIICTDEKMKPWLEENILKEDASWLFDFANLRKIDNKLREFGHEIDEIPNVYLPKPGETDVKPLKHIKWFEKDEILKFQDDSRFDQAFGFEENFPDVLGVAAYDGDNIIGMAGASQDCDSLYQIGIDVLPDYRGRGIGTNLIAILKQELLKRDKVPFYSTSASHLFSRNIAVNAGFFPAWVEMYSRQIKE